MRLSCVGCMRGTAQWRRTVAALVLVLGLLAAACGSGASTHLLVKAIRPHVTRLPRLMGASMA